MRTIPELIVAFNHGAIKQDVSEDEQQQNSEQRKRENVALKLIIKIGEICKLDGKLDEYIDILIAGFGGDSVLTANTILTLKGVVAHFVLNLTVNTLQFLLKQVLSFLVGKNRIEVEASIKFLNTFVRVLPAQFVALHLDTIVRSLSAMVPDTRRYCRKDIKIILEKLCRRFTAEEVIKLVPGDDEMTHKKLKNIRKSQNRAKRTKAANAEEESDDEEMGVGLEKQSYTYGNLVLNNFIFLTVHIFVTVSTTFWLTPTQISTIWTMKIEDHHLLRSLRSSRSSRRILRASSI